MILSAALLTSLILADARPASPCIAQRDQRQRIHRLISGPRP
jgi:hypothetical protein